MCWVHGGEMVIVPASDIETLAVLFIADDPDLAEMYRLKLELDGYWVRVVVPATAVAQARRERPEIVFLDLLNGGRERLKVLPAVRDAVHRPKLPAIVLTAARGQELEEQGVVLSAYDYVLKIPLPDSLPTPSATICGNAGQPHRLIRSPSMSTRSSSFTRKASRSESSTTRWMHTSLPAM